MEIPGAEQESTPQCNGTKGGQSKLQVNSSAQALAHAEVKIKITLGQQDTKSSPSESLKMLQGSITKHYAAMRLYNSKRKRNV